MSNETMNHETNDNMADLVPAGDAISDKLPDALTRGQPAEGPPAVAPRAGAFRVAELTAHAAAESGDDLADLDAALEPAFLDDDGPSNDLPPVPTTTNARELYGLRDGETVADAIARRDQSAEG